jgi:hypothetical protein
MSDFNVIIKQEAIQIRMRSPVKITQVIQAQTLQVRMSASQLPAAAAVADWNTVTNKPTAFTPVAHGHLEAEITDLQPLVDPVLLFENALI